MRDGSFYSSNSLKVADILGGMVAYWDLNSGPTP
jgi:hypothetical protein